MLTWAQEIEANRRLKERLAVFLGEENVDHSKELLRDLSATDRWGHPALRWRDIHLNREGMTWQEWADAANVPVETYSHCYYQLGGSPWVKVVRAWMRGEDPTDWRKDGQR